MKPQSPAISNAAATGKQTPNQVLGGLFTDNIEKDASIVVIDCKGTMVEQLRQLEVFNPHEPPYSQRLIIIDPTLFPPAINMFAPPKRIYEGKVADHVLNNTVSLLSYVFSSKESSLTDKQLTPLSFAIGLLFSIPGADMRMFLKLLNDPPNPKGGMRPASFFKQAPDIVASGAHDLLIQGLVLRDLDKGLLQGRLQIEGSIPINLKKDEVILWMFKAVSRFEPKTSVSYAGSSQGLSFSVMRGVSYRVGAFKGHRIETPTLASKGIGDLYVTSSAVYFVGSLASYTVAHKKISAVEQYSDGILLHLLAARTRFSY